MHSFNPNDDRHLASVQHRAEERWLWIGPALVKGAQVNGHRWRESIAEASAETEPFDRVVWRISAANSEPQPKSLTFVSRLLRDRGNLTLAFETPEAVSLAQEIDETIGRLSELGYVILGEDTDDQLNATLGKPRQGSIRTWLHARRDRFQVRGYRAGDEEAILRLFTPSFHAERSLEHWRWKYLQNPFGQVQLSMAFAPSGELAAHHGAYPVPFRQPDGSRFRALQIGDLMTDPRFRRVGLGPRSLLARCAVHSYATLGRRRVAFNYGFNTATSLAYSLRFMCAHKVQPVDFWTWNPPANLHITWPGSIEVTNSPAKDLDAFFSRVAPSYGLLVERRQTYLNWRYFRRPDVDYLVVVARRWRRLVGWSVFRREADRLIWGDALFHPRHATGAAQACLAKALRSPYGDGVAKVESWFSPRPSWWAEVLEQLEFKRHEEPNGLWMTCVPHDDTKAPETLRSLYYTKGDGDLF